jgi:hypothetical protein
MASHIAHMPDQAKHVGDAVAATLTIGTLATWLPPVAALLTIVWTFIRIYETKTMQKILRTRNRRKRK